MSKLLVLICAALLGVIHGFSFGYQYAATLQLLSFTVFAALVFKFRSQLAWESVAICVASFTYSSYATGLRWIAEYAFGPQALGPLLGTMVYGGLIVGLSTISILLQFAAVRFAGAHFNDALTAALFACAWVGADFLREVLLPSFPWLMPGYDHIASPFGALLPYVGVQGLSWVVEWSAALLAAAIFALSRSRVPQFATLGCLGVVALATVAAHVFGSGLTRDASSLNVALLQTAISQREKFRATAFGSHLTEVAEFAESHAAQLVLTPETAIPTSIRSLTPTQLRLLQHAVANGSRALLFGAFAEDTRGDVFNSAVLLQTTEGTESRVQQTVYIKQHLAPIGEYAPPGLGWIADLLGVPMTNIRSTVDTPRNFKVAGITVIPTVCQDLLYGDDLRTTTLTPRILVNLSNLATFDSPLLREQFMNIGRARAMEQQVPLLIAANFGPTASIEATGRIEQLLPPRIAGTLVATIRPRIGVTPYARWGNAFLYGVFGATGVLTGVAIRRRTAKSPQSIPKGPQKRWDK